MQCRDDEYCDGTRKSEEEHLQGLYQVDMSALYPAFAVTNRGSKLIGSKHAPRRDLHSTEQVPRSDTWDYSESRGQKLPEHGGSFSPAHPQGVGATTEVWGWRKAGARGARKVWTLRREAL